MEHPSAKATWLVRLCPPLLLLAAACGPGEADEGYVVLDPQARRAGFVLEVDGEVRSTPLPVAVAVGDGTAPVLAGPERREALEMAPGELIHVRGDEGALERGTPDLDQLRVRSDEASARAFAARIGITPAADGPSRWMLQGSDVLRMTALFEDADAAGLFSSAPIFVAHRARETESEGARAERDVIDAQAAARASGGHASDSAFKWEGPDADTEMLAEFYAAAANGTARRSPAELAADRAQIERDLEVTLSVDGKVFRAGESMVLRAALVNRGLTERWVITPKDGSEMGWREPYVFYTVKHEAAPGVWVDAPKERYSRCGNYNDQWGEDVVALAPGGKLPLDHEMLPVLSGFDLQATGRYRISAHYQYRGGGGGRGLFSNGKAARVPEELEGMPAFEVVSAPVEVRVVRPVDVVVTLKAPLRIGPTTTVDSMIDVSFVNRSGQTVDMPAEGDEHRIFIEVEVNGEHPWVWYSSWDKPRLAFATGRPLEHGARASLFEGVNVVLGEGRLFAATKGPFVARVRAGVSLWAYNDPRHTDVRSSWVEAPIEWIGPDQGSTPP